MTFNLARFLADLQVKFDDLQARLDRLDPAPPDRPRGGTARPATDPYGSSMRWTTGVVADSIPFYDCYRVLLEGGGGAAICTRARQADTAPTGVSDADALAPGCRVLVALHRSETEGYITAVLPPAVYDRRQLLHDQVSQASPDTRSADPFAADLAARPASDLADRSGGSHLDASAVGEFSRGCASTGVRLHVDPYMTFLRASEECGVYAFVQDDCLRTSGRYRQDWHPGGESSVCPSAAGQSVTCYSGFTPYQWESLGAARRTTVTGQNVTALECQVTSPYKAGAEPVEADQAPLFRFVEHAGPLPGGRRSQVIAPTPAAGVNSYSAPLPVVVVGDRHAGLDGRDHSAFAAGFESAMRPGLVGYAPSAAVEDLPAADQPPPAVAPSGDLPSGIGAAMVADDLYAYRQWAAGVGFVRAGWTPSGDPLAEAAVDYQGLSSDYAVPDPDPVEKEVFEGVTAKRYPRAAGFNVLPNGTVAIFGPCGESIILGEGKILIDAPNIEIRSGRDTLFLAGRDLALRSHRDIDLASANGSVRQKAEADFAILSGNGGTGSLLLEGRGSGGVITKSSGLLAQQAESVYTRAERSAVTQVTDGGIIDISQTAVRRIESSASDFFGPVAEPTAVNLFTASGSQVVGPLSLIGRLAVTDGASFGGSISVSYGHVFTADADQYDGRIPQLGEETVDRMDEANQRLADQQDGRVQAGIESYADRFADDPAFVGVAFGFRPSDEVGVTGFALYEGRWRQRARLGGQTLSGWEEPTVTGPRGEPTMPYPGFEVWTSACVRSVDLVLYDVTTGRPVPADAAYVSAAYPAATPATPGQILTVIS